MNNNRAANAGFILGISLKKILWLSVGLLIVIPLLITMAGKVYQGWDADSERGAVAIENGKFGESYQVPEYLDQGWDANASLWFYNTTQGSALLPYSFLLALEQPDQDAGVTCDRNGVSGNWFLCPEYIDDFRYLPQKSTFFNPDGLPVGFAKEVYKAGGHWADTDIEKPTEYVGLTCAACHTGQVNFGNRALRIDGGPAMADMVGFLERLTDALEQTLVQTGDQSRQQRFVARVLESSDDFDSAEAVIYALEKWFQIRKQYNVINAPRTNQCVFPEREYALADCNADSHITHKVDYGYARLDAFGRIYNRVLQHAINVQQFKDLLRGVTRFNGKQAVLTPAQIEKVFEGVANPEDAVLRDGDFVRIMDHLQSTQPGYPGLSKTDMLRVRNALFNSPNAPVSYPFLWDITHADYVQWNGLAGNALLGPLGRNAGEVIGVFAILDWRSQSGWAKTLNSVSISAYLTGQKKKARVIDFQSSVDLFNLQRLESHLVSLRSPQWPFCKKQTGDEADHYYLPVGEVQTYVDQRDCAGDDQRFDQARLTRGRLLFAEHCQSCHHVIDPNAFDRLMVSSMVGINHQETTDETMARNGVHYVGKSGNFKDTYQSTDVGTLVVGENAPVVQILTAATKGVVTTPDADKSWIRRVYEWLYTLIMSVFDNPVTKSTIKAGDYMPDTTTKPYNSLLAYRGRSLNGIWATAPYLHNGSVPSLYDLMSCVAERPVTFRVGARQFDPVHVGFNSTGYDGFLFDTRIAGNSNKGHEYGVCDLDHEQRMSLVEYMKSL